MFWKLLHYVAPFVLILILGCTAQRDISWSRRASPARTISIELPSPDDAKRSSALQDDVFYCRAVSVAKKYEDAYLVNFALSNTKQAPLARAPTMLVFGCTELPDKVKRMRDPEALWDCSSVCKSGERLIWALSYEVGPEAFQLPASSGYWVGGDSTIQYIVVQGKYDLRDKIDTAAFEELEKAASSKNSLAQSVLDAVDETDSTRSQWRPLVSLTVTSTRPRHLVGVLLLESTVGSLPAGSTLAYADASCMFKPALRGGARIVALRVHAHAAGRRIAGYLFNGTQTSDDTASDYEGEDEAEEDSEGTGGDYYYYEQRANRRTGRPARRRNESWAVFELGERDPRLPQVFVQARDGLTVQQHDALFARCSYDTSTRSTRTEFGARAFDEMCNLFVMYTFDSAELDAGPSDYYAYTEADEFRYGKTDRRDLLPAFAYCARNDLKRLFEQLVPRLTGLAQADAPAAGRPHTPSDVRAAGAFTIGRVHLNVSRAVAPGRHLVPDTTFRLPESTAARSLSAQLGFSTSSSRIGQVCGVATDAAHQIYIFHRGSLPPTRFLDWLSMARPQSNATQSRQPKKREANATAKRNDTPTSPPDTQFPPIAEDTIVVLDSNGGLVESFGAGHFSLPRAIHVDSFGAVYLADSFQHAVSVFAPTDRSRPARVFGATVLCGPSSIVTDVDPDNVDQLGVMHEAQSKAAVRFVYVADGDCLSVSPSRVVQFAADGSLVAELHSGLPHGVMLAPNALGDSLALAAPTRLSLHGPYICASNREHANLVCWSRRDAALVSAIDVSTLGDRLVASTVAGDTMHMLAGASVFCDTAPRSENHSETRPLCGQMAGYSVDTLTGDVVDVWNAAHDGFDVPVDVACAADGSFLVVAELYPTATVRKFVMEDAAASRMRTLGELFTAAMSQSNMSKRRMKALPTTSVVGWSLSGVSATGGVLVALMVIVQLTCCAVCITCCCKKLRSGGVCGMKLATRRRSPVKLNVDLSEPLIDGAGDGRVVTDVAQMANDVVAKWRVGIADLKEAVSTARSGGASRRGGFAAIPQYDSETDEIIDTTCVEDVTIAGGSLRGPTAGANRNGAALPRGRVSVNESVRRAVENVAASKKVRFAMKRNAVQEDATA